MEQTFRFAFVMDQQVGLKTAAMNLERGTSADKAVQAEFIPVQYQADIGLLNLLPLPGSMKGTLRGIAEIRKSVPNPAQYDAVLWGTWAAKAVPELIRATPAFIRLDMTPVQMQAMGKEYSYSSGRARFMQGWKQRSTVQLYKEARHLFPWSNYVADSLHGDYGVPREKITVISPGTDTERFTPDLERLASAQNDVVRLLFVGGDFLRKGGDLLLDWMAKRGSQMKGVRVELHLVTRDTVAEAENIPGVFVYHGITNNSPELIALYRQSDIFVLPTRGDCYSLVAMEAMACGVPVVITALGGIPDIVDEGKTGFLLEREDARTLGERLETLISEPERRRAMGTLSRQVACEKFDSRLCAERLLRIMKSKSRKAAGQENASVAVA